MFLDFGNRCLPDLVHGGAAAQFNLWWVLNVLPYMSIWVSSRFSIFFYPPSINMPVVRLATLNCSYMCIPLRVYSCLTPCVSQLKNPLWPRSLYSSYWKWINKWMNEWMNWVVAGHSWCDRTPVFHLHVLRLLLNWCHMLFEFWCFDILSFVSGLCFGLLLWDTPGNPVSYFTS